MATKKSVAVAKELLEATGIQVKTGTKMAAVYDDILDFVTDEKKCPDEVFEAFSADAKHWIEVAVEANNDDESIPSMASVLDGKQSKPKGGKTMTTKKTSSKKAKKTKAKKAAPAKKAARKGNGVDSAAVVAAARVLKKKKVDQSKAYKQLRKQFNVTSLNPIFKREGFAW